MTQISLPLLSSKKNIFYVPRTSGLNWGQRPGRNRNQGYIPIPASIQRNGFFPEPGVRFNIICDDGFSFIGVRAQANGKALESPENNAIIGSYFRLRLGVPSEDLVTLDHLRAYGRTSVDIRKISDLYFQLDFANT
jgi:hypothetical protein